MVTKKDLAQQLNTLLVEEGWAESTALTATTRLAEDLALDSFDYVRLVLALNASFDLELGSKDIIPQHFNTIGTLIELVYSKLT